MQYVVTKPAHHGCGAGDTICNIMIDQATIFFAHSHYKAVRMRQGIFLSVCHISLLYVEDVTISLTPSHRNQ